jgi:hypothetical protein
MATPLSPLSPQIVDAMRTQYEAMGFVFDTEAFAESVSFDGTMIELARGMGLPIEEIAQLLIQKMAVDEIEHYLPKCIREMDSLTLISMRLEDLRFAHGYLTLVEAGAKITPEQTKRAVEIACSLRDVAADEAEYAQHLDQ